MTMRPQKGPRNSNRPLPMPHFLLRLLDAQDSPPILHRLPFVLLTVQPSLGFFLRLIHPGPRPVSTIALKVTTDRKRREKNKKGKNSKFNCRICDMQFVHSGQQALHEANGKHQREKQRLKVSKDPPWCTECNIYFAQLIDLEIHRRSKKHRKKFSFHSEKGRNYSILLS